MRGSGGWGGIRTLDALADILVFETSAFSHSATHPSLVRTTVSRPKGPAANGAPLLAKPQRTCKRGLIRNGLRLPWNSGETAPEKAGKSGQNRVDTPEIGSAEGGERVCQYV